MSEEFETTPSNAKIFHVETCSSIIPQRLKDFIPRRQRRDFWYLEARAIIGE